MHSDVCVSTTSTSTRLLHGAIILSITSHVNRVAEITKLLRAHTATKRSTMAASGPFRTCVSTRNHQPTDSRLVGSSKFTYLVPFDKPMEQSPVSPTKLRVPGRVKKSAKIVRGTRGHQALSSFETWVYRPDRVVQPHPSTNWRGQLCITCSCRRWRTRYILLLIKLF